MEVGDGLLEFAQFQESAQLQEAEQVRYNLYYFC